MNLTRQTSLTIRAVFVVVLLTSLVAPASAADWPNWRGPNHDGISAEKKISVRWKKPKLLWERDIGSGFSAVSGVGDLVYTCGTEGGKQVLICLNASSGDVVWNVPIEGELRERQGGDGARATPAVSDGKVYIFGARGTLLCADAKSGSTVWKKSYDDPPQWKYSGSVLIEGDLAVLSPGGGAGGLLALNKETGEQVWKAGSGRAGYATPYPFTFKKKRYIVGFLAKQVIIADAKSGEEVWSTGWKTSYDVNAATPIFHEGHLFIGSGYGTGCALFRLSSTRGKLSGKEMWRNSSLRSKFQTCVLSNGYLYGADEQAFKCVSLSTGKVLWRKDRLTGKARTKHGTVTMAAGYLIFLSESGMLQIGRVSPKGFAPSAAANVLTGRCWTVPTLHDGRLYLRNFEKLVCLDLRKK